VICAAPRAAEQGIVGCDRVRLAHVPAKHAPGLDPRVESGSPRRTVVRQGEPLFADKDMRQHKNLLHFPFILVHYVNLDHLVIQYERKTL
jgi:hypothetical protein